MISWRGRSSAWAEVVKPATFNAPLFRKVAERLDTGRHWVLLDLGAAHRQTVSFFSQYRCRLDVANMSEELDELNAESDPRCLENAAEALLPVRHNDTTDIVLCWDVLNYFEPAALTAMMSRVAARACSGTMLHALIAYSDDAMPVQPGNFIPLDECTLFDLSAFQEERPAPRYTPVDLAACLKGFVMDRVVLLSNGMQEFLFRRI